MTGAYVSLANLKKNVGLLFTDPENLNWIIQQFFSKGGV